MAAHLNDPYMRTPHMAEPGACAVMLQPCGCELCQETGGVVLVETPQLRIVLVDDSLYPGFCRVIWREHVAEMTDLPPASRSLLMQAVCKVEQVMRTVLQPDKINLASLGNQTPHLHWHVIARFVDDAHFPQPVWGQQQRNPTASWLAARTSLLPQLRDAMVLQWAPLDGATPSDI